MEKQAIDLSRISLNSQRYFNSLKESNLFNTSLKSKQNSNCTPKFQKRKIVVEKNQNDKTREVKKKIEDKQPKIKIRVKQRSYKRNSLQEEQEESSHLSSEKLKKLEIKNTGISLDQLKKINPLKSQQLNIFKKNTFKLYSPTNVLPTINKNKNLEKEIFQKKKSNDINLIQFGIFTETKDTHSFLRKIRQTLQHQFVGRVNVHSEQDLYKLQFYLLNQIYHEGKWLND